MKTDNKKVYFNPRTNVIGEGIYYFHKKDSLSFFLITKELDNQELEVVDVTKTWLDEWEYMGEL